jgi:hypothetical protein
MRQKGMIVAGAFVLAVLSTQGSSSAQEKRLKKSDLPAAVQRTAEEQSKGAIVNGYSREMDQGKPVYEVAMTVNGHTRDVSIDAEGMVIEVEEQVALQSLPAPVRVALEKKAATGRITKVESLTKRGVLVAYEAQVRAGNKKSEIQVGPGGESLARPE